MGWLMGLMAAQAIVVNHVFRVAAVAFQTLLVFTVLLMALIAIHFSVRAGIFNHGFTGFAVAGQAYRFDRADFA